MDILLGRVCDRLAKRAEDHRAAAEQADTGWEAEALMELAAELDEAIKLVRQVWDEQRAGWAGVGGRDSE